MMEWTKTHFTVVMMDEWLQLSKLEKIIHAVMILYPYYLPLDFLFLVLFLLLSLMF